MVVGYMVYIHCWLLPAIFYKCVYASCFLSMYLCHHTKNLVKNIAFEFQKNILDEALFFSKLKKYINNQV